MRVIIRIRRASKRPGAEAASADSSSASVDLRAVWCPGCGSRYVKVSRARSVLDLAWSIFGYGAFRCLTCGRRFHFRAPPA